MRSGKRVPIIGLCGRSGSGKTTVCKAFEAFGIRSVDTDAVYRELISPTPDGEPSELVRNIADCFGDGVMAADGSLDRRALAEAVFGEGKSENLALLNSLTHGPILARTEEIAAEYIADGATAVIVDAPALFESGFDKKCDAILCVTAPDDILAGRIIARDGITEDAARKRLSSQIPEAELVSRSDFVIVNDGICDLSEAAAETAQRIFAVND